MDRVEDVDYKENDESARIVSELVDDIRDVVIDYQVSRDPNSSSGSLHSGNWSRRRTSKLYMIRISN